MDTQLRADDGTVLRFANRLYERAEEPDGWEEALHEIADSLRGTALCVHSYQLGKRRGEAVRVLRGITAEQAREYQEHHSPHNAWMARVRTLPTRADVLLGHELCPQDELVRDRFYRDFLEPKGLLDLVAVILDAGGAELTSLNVLRGDEPGLFTEDEARLMRRLAPHICNVYRVERRFAEIRSRRALLREVIDRIPTAVMAVKPDLRIVVANRAAEALLASNDGLKVSRGVLEIYDCVARDGMQEAVGALAAMRHGDGISAGASFPIGRPSVARPYSATVVPLRPLTTDAPTCDACCLLFVEDPEDRTLPPERRLMEIWGLTEAEARVAALLAAGHAPREVADTLQVSFNTVRTHLQRIFVKTDTPRQADLIRLITRLGVAMLED